MAGRNKISTLRKKMGPERVARNKARTDQELTLIKLRQAIGLTQGQVADQMGISQPGLSKMENQTDIGLGTLRRYVEALGGNLEIRAVFDKESMLIDPCLDGGA